MGYKCLKCRYSDKGPALLFADEYVVTFKCLENKNPKLMLPEGMWPQEGEEWCIVKKEDVKPEKDNSGLVKVLLERVDEENEKAVVGIYNSPDQQTDYFPVPLSEVLRE